MIVGIVGLGLIGGTYARNLIDNHTVYGIDINAKSLSYAEKNRIIDKGFENPKKILSKCDLVIICLYPNQILDFVTEYNAFFKTNAVLTDAAGIKEKIVKEIENVLRDDLDFIFAHPVAGRETVGVENSYKGIFKNGNYVITPTPRNKISNINLIEELALELGFKKVSKITAKEHDEIISYTSQLTHIIALALVNSDDFKYNTKLFIGDSYKDLTRIANINTKLWGELFFGNKENLVNKVDLLIDNLTKYRKSLENDDIDKLEALMEDAKEKLGRLNES